MGMLAGPETLQARVLLDAAGQAARAKATQRRRRLWT